LTAPRVYFGASMGSVGVRVQYGPHHSIGLRIGRGYWRPSAESWGGGEYRCAQAFGVTVWQDRTRPQTVAERGAW